jgi:cathepsin L
MSHTHRLGHNQISDFTKEELAKLSGLNIQKPTHTDATTFVPGKVDLPLSVNWVDAGKVGPIKDQGQCGSCWAFSATATVESSIAIDNGTTPGNYSEQQLVSCSSAYGNLGCSGGWYFWAWDYLEVNAQENGADYFYTSGTTGLNGNCYADTSRGVAKVSNYV